MAQISFIIPDAQISRVVDAINGTWEKPDNLTPAQWAKEKLRQYILQVVREYEYEQARKTAAATVNVPDNLIT